MTNLTEDRLTRAGHDVRRAVAALPDAAPPHRRRPIGALAAAGAAALVVILALAVPALLRSDPEVVGPAAPPASPAPLSGALVVAADIELGDIAVNSLVDAGDRLVAMAIQRRAPADPVVLSAGPDGREWTRIAESFVENDLGPQAVAGDVHVAIGATGGAGTTVYRSGDRGRSWAPVAIPLPPGHAQRVAQQVFATSDGGFVAAGISTPTTFDDDHQSAVWTSPDGVTWEPELLGSHGPQPVHAEGIAEVDGRVVVFAGGGIPGRVFAYEQQPGGGWSASDLTPVVAGQAGAGELVNLDFIGAAIVDGHLQAWWAFGVMGGGEIVPGAFTVRRPAGNGPWEAKPLTGPVPVALAMLDGEIIGLAPVDPAERYATPSGVLVVGSHAGVAWHELARYDDVWLRHLVVADGGEVVAAGTRLGTGEPGKALVRVLQPTGTVIEMLGEEPGG